MKQLNIDTRAIGVGHPVFVIAEIGVNHDGSVQKAVELVRIAAACGADAVKVQVFRAANLVHPSCDFAEYQRGRTADATPIDMLRRYELSTPDLRQVVREIISHDMMPLATPFSPADIEVIASLRLPALKIASPDLVNLPLLRAAAKLGKPLLISTGAATMEEVATTVSWLREWQASFALLHCVSAYPTPNDQANLAWIGELASRFDEPVGYSDHTVDTVCGALAVAAGAMLIERHLTYDRAARGPDHASSSDPTQFHRYIKHVHEAEVFRGASGKRVLEIEENVRKESRQSLVVKRTLAAGDVLREADLTVQRPGTGLPASQIMLAVGRKLTKPTVAGTLLQWDMLDAA